MRALKHGLILLLFLVIFQVVYEYFFRLGLIELYRLEILTNSSNLIALVYAVYVFYLYEKESYLLDIVKIFNEEIEEANIGTDDVRASVRMFISKYINPVESELYRNNLGVIGFEELEDNESN